MSNNFDEPLTNICLHTLWTPSYTPHTQATLVYHSTHTHKRTCHPRFACLYSVSTGEIGTTKHHQPWNTANRGYPRLITVLHSSHASNTCLSFNAHTHTHTCKACQLGTSTVRMCVCVCIPWQLGRLVRLHTTNCENTTNRGYPRLIIVDILAAIGY